MKAVNFVVFFFALFAFSNIVFAADAFVNSSIVTTAIKTNAIAANTTVNGNASYSVLFNTSATAYNRTAFNITFPAGFILTNAIPANRSGTTGFFYLNGTYNGSLGYTFRITGQVFEIFVIINGSQPAGNWSNTNFNVTIANVQNTNVSATFQTTISAFDAVQNNLTTEGPNVSTAFSLGTYPAYNISIYSGDGQTRTINSSLVTNITALVTDDFGNAINGYPVNFTALNFTLYDSRIGLNSTHATMYQSLNATTNSTGHAGIFAFIGNTTLNASTTRYGYNATGFNLTINATSYQTPQASRISYYLLTPSTTEEVATDTAFTILVSSYDVFHNINGTSAWNGTINVTPSAITGLTYSTDGTTYVAWSDLGVNRVLTNGNVTTWFKQSVNADLTFNFTDTGNVTATGVSTQVKIRSSGVSGGGGNSGTSSPSPSPSPTTGASATPTPSPTAVIDKKVDSSTQVKGSFFSSSASFELTYTAGSEGFYGDLTWKLPFDYADYQAGLVTITPAPKRAVSGSVLATWENVNLKPGQKFIVTVRVDKDTDETVMQQFAAPTLTAKTRPTAAPTTTVQQPSSTPTYQTSAQGQKADYTLWLILALVIIAGGAYYFLKSKKKPKGL